MSVGAAEATETDARAATARTAARMNVFIGHIPYWLKPAISAWHVQLLGARGELITHVAAPVIMVERS